MQAPNLKDIKRITLKLGSLLLLDEQTGAVRTEWLAALAEDIVALRKAGKEILVVSSGAVALGRSALGIAADRPLSLAEKQAAAACGQIALAEAWQQALRPHDIAAAQMLLSAADTENRRRYLNARAAIRSLLELGAVSIINENDSVATEELRYGDNDRLAARVAAMASCEALVLLSDIDGLYSADPKMDSSASFIPLVEQMDERIWAMAGQTQETHSTGGMITKLQAAEIATQAGCAMAIAPGREQHPLRALQQGGRATWFTAPHDPLSARKHWIASAVGTQGSLSVDDGAARALAEGASLLPAGVSAIQGPFRRGDSVRILNQSGTEIAIGLCAYDEEDTRKIAGKQSSDIERILGYGGPSALIHRDDLVVRDAGTR